MEQGDDAVNNNGSKTSVFFSYSRVNRIDAIPIINMIEAAGYSVWWDGMLEGGAEFLKDTEDALENANAVVVLWSGESIESHWVRDEATSGRQRKRLIPLSLDGTLPPLGFRQIQAIDMRNWRTNDDAKTQILRRLALLHDRPVLGLNRQTTLDSTHPHSKTGLSRRALMIGGGITGLGIVTALGWRLVSRSSSGDIAVLPFENLLGDDAFDYLSHGLASAVRDHLARNRALNVIARSSSREVAKETSDARRVAKILKVDHVLEGRLERLGSDERLSVDLISGREGRVAWTESFPFSEETVLPLRDVIVQNLVERLASSAEAQENSLRVNPAAYDAYMRGEELLEQRGSLAAIQGARDHFQRAVNIDPDFGLARAALANQLLILGVINSDKGQSRALIDAALESAQIGVNTHPNFSTTHAVLGQVLATGKLDFARAESAFLKAQELGFSNSSDRSRFALFKSIVGNPDVALQTMREGVRLDPLNPSMYEVLAYLSYASGDFDAAAELYQTVLKMDPERYTVRAWLGLSEIYRGDANAGLAACADEQNLMERLTCEAIAYDKTGDRASAQSRYSELVETFGDAAAYQQAQIKSQAGAIDEAMDILHLAEELEDTGLSMVMTDPALNPLRDREDFRALLARRGLGG